MAEITIVKGETAAADRTWLTPDDGSARRVAVHVIHDLPHLVVESLFGIEDGLCGVLARGGFSAANRAATARDSRRAKLVTDAEFDELAAENRPGHRVAKAATRRRRRRGAPATYARAGGTPRRRHLPVRHRRRRRAVQVLVRPAARRHPAAAMAALIVEAMTTGDCRPRGGR